MPKVLYKENNQTISSKTSLLLGALLLVLFVSGFFVSSVLFLIGMIGIISLLTYWFIGYASKVEVTTEAIKTIKGSISLRDIDRSLGIQPAAEVLSQEDIDKIRMKRMSQSTAHYKLIGGAYGRKSIKVDWLAFKTTSNPEKTLLIAVTDPQKFIEAVSQS